MAGNPCLDCGACCATFRVSFYWAEALSPGQEMLEALTEKLDHHRIAMIGTNQKQPRCIALQGDIGETVNCAVYHQRPSPCREFESGTDRCLAARRKHGLGPIIDVSNDLCA